jgi:hypothetical protein
VHPDKQHPLWDHNLHRTLSDANTKAADAELSLCHVNRGFNMFNIFPVFSTTSLCPTSSIQCRLVCLTTSRSGFST